MSNQNPTWDRRELYEKVWQFPLRKLAAEYGISNVGLVKVCCKLEIPLPGLGHWTKIACGHSIPRLPLLALENVLVLVRHIRRPEIAVLPEDAPELERIKRVALGTTPIVTKAMLAHPLIEKTRQVLNNAPKDKEKIYASHELEWLDLRVTKNCLSRATHHGCANSRAGAARVRGRRGEKGHGIHTCCRLWRKDSLRTY
jgi:hypothetical protein